MTDICNPEDCTSMTEVRAGVDDVDRKVIGLLARRFGYMDAAARIKPDRSVVRDEKRKAEVLDKIRVKAADHGLQPEVIARLYDQLIEDCIAYELEQFDHIHTSECAAAAPKRESHHESP